MTRGRSAFGLLIGIATGCADFIGPDPAGAGGSAGSTPTSTTSSSNTGGNGVGGSGNDGGGGAGGGPSGPVTSLSVGKSHACAVVEGDVWCWGSNMFSALGVTAPTTDCRSKPEKVLSTVSFRSVGVGDKHTCALATDGVVWCWGTNSDGQVVGDGANNNSIHDTPSAVALRKQADQLSVGAAHNCVVSVDNTVVCWGANFVGQSAPTVDVDHVTPTVVAAQLDTSSSLVVAAGLGETCISNGTAEVECFGGNDDIHGRDNASCMVSGQNAFPLSAEVAQLSVGAEQACALFENGTHECWGSVPPTTCGTLGGGWCAGTPSDGCVITPSLRSAEAVAATEGYWCAAADSVTCTDSPMLGAQPVPATKTLAQLGMDGVRLLSASGQRVVCASDSFEVVCWGPVMSAALCNNPEDEVIQMSFQ